MEVTCREELLAGLSYIHDRLGVLSKLMSRYIELEKLYRAELAYTGLKARTEEIQTHSVKSRGKLLVIALSSTIAVFYILLSLLSGMSPGTALLFLIPVLILIFGGKRKKLKVAALIFLVAMIAIFTFVLIRHAPPAAAAVLGILLAVIVVVEVVVILFYNSRYVVGKNRKTDAYNARIIQDTDAKNAEIARGNEQVSMVRERVMDEYDEVCTQLKRNTPWFPPDYYYLEAVEHFIHAVRNFKVDTISEMVKEYDTCVSREQQLEEQRKTNQRLDQIINNQQKSAQLAQEQNALLRKQNAMLGLKFMQDQFNADRQYAATQESGSRIQDSVDRNTQAVKNFHNTIRRG